MSANLSVLLIGCGEHSRENLIPSLAAIPGVDVQGLCDCNPIDLELAERWFPSARTYNDAFLLTESNISDYSAVVVAATPQIHAKIARMALENGVAVFLEKPPVVGTSELEDLIAIATTRNLVTCVGHNLRHSDAAGQFRAVIDNEEFGRPIAMEMRYFASKPRGQRWNIESPIRSFLLSHANHAIDLMIFQLGSIKKTVAARAWPDVNGGVAIAVQFAFESGAVGNLLGSSYAPHFTFGTTVLSDTGMLVEMNGLQEVVVNHSKFGKRWSRRWTPRTLETGYQFAGYQSELAAFFLAVIEKRPNQIQPSFRDELEVYRAIDEIEVSLNSQIN